MITISSINLSLTQTRSNTLSQEINSYSNASFKVNYNNRIRLILRTLSNIANGYEPKKMSFMPGDKTIIYTNRLMELIN